MAFEDVKQYFENVGMEDRVIELEKSSATVEEAANVIGCKPSQIAKTLSFLVDGKPILIVAAGDSKVDNRKYKNTPIQIGYFLANLYQGKTLSFYLFFYYETFLFHSVTTFQ